MEHSYDEWVSNANEALEISLVHAAPIGLRPVASFHPKFTYSIFGNEETIFGYQDLRIQLRYHASDMRPNLHVGYTDKLKVVGENEPTDIPAVLQDFLPPVAFQKSSEFEDAVKHTASAAAAYTPPGELLQMFSCSDGRYEIWKGSLADPAVKQLVNRIQIFVPLFIEGGTLISTDGSDPADRWSIYFLYRTRQQAGTADKYDYEFAGYSTVYRFLLPVAATPPPTASEEEDAQQQKKELDLGSSSTFSLSKLPCRSRLSQFVILPPFQGKGHAGRLYKAIYIEYLHEPQTTELTVEDPNEAFDDVRDLVDLASLSQQPGFAKTVRIDTSVTIPKTGPSPRNIVDPVAIEKLRREAKIAPRQFHRIVEMSLMQKLAPAVRPTLEEDEEETASGKSNGKGKAAAVIAPATKEQQHEYKLWRLFVKQRLYRHNKEILGQLERGQRIDKLEETLVSVELEYARILSMFESRTKLAAEKPTMVVQRVPQVVPASAATGGKRKLDDDDGNETDSSTKKARVGEEA